MSNQTSEPAKPTPLTHNLFPLSSQQSLSIILMSIGLGIVANLLLRSLPLGINLSLFSLNLGACLYFLPRKLELELKPNPLLLTGLVLLALTFSWRASLFLQVLNVSVQLFLTLLIAGQLSLSKLKNSNATELLINSIRTSIGFLFSPFRLLFQSPWKELSNPSKLKSSERFIAISRGLIFALPLVFIFAILLASADALFANILETSFNFKFNNLTSQLFFTLFASIAALSFLSQSFIASPWLELDSEAPPLLQFGIIETSIVFGSLILLFLSFMLVQGSYLFASFNPLISQALIENSSLTYAAYGRRGFFELVTVTVLLHIVLLLGLWFTQAKAQQLYKTLASSLVVLLFGIIISAFSRLNLYIASYGLTELRFYSSALIVWIAVIMVYFLVRLFYKKVPKILISYLVLGLLGVLSLYAVNPDARIAHTNLNRIDSAVELDIDYLYNLSLDATASIAKHLNANKDNLAESTLTELENLLSYQAQNQKALNWRSFNFGRWQGRSILKTHQTTNGWQFDSTQ